MIPRRIAIVLFNLGGPNTISSVYPFLKNLFSDPFIIQAPHYVRGILSSYLAWSRSFEAQKNYQKMGGSSPLLQETYAQGDALETWLKSMQTQDDFRVFVTMRHWTPLIQDNLPSILEYNPSTIVLLPLYPQFSTTTTLSFFKEWDHLTKNLWYETNEVKIPSYPGSEYFLQAYEDLIRQHYKQAIAYGKPCVIFSAHGLPQKIVRQGDPYPEHVRTSVNGMVSLLKKSIPDLDYTLGYQSRVGPLKWLEPSLDQCLEEAAKTQKPVLIVPISFVSEHSETKIELDEEYREKAHSLGIPFYGRVSTVRTHPLFIEALGQLVIQSVGRNM